MEKKEIINELLKNGAKEVKGLKVRTVTVSVMDNYTRLGLTIDREVDGYVLGEDGKTFERGTTKVIFVSLFAVASVLKENPDVAFAANHLVEHPNAMNVILSGADINIIQEEVAKAIQITCETVPVSVNIKVVKVG